MTKGLAINNGIDRQKWCGPFTKREVGIAEHSLELVISQFLIINIEYTNTEGLLVQRLVCAWIDLQIVLVWPLACKGTS